MPSGQPDVLPSLKGTQCPTASRSNFLQLTSFDRNVALILLVLLALVAFTILLGDRVGVTLQLVAPQGVTGSTSSVIMQFSENMNRVTVPPQLQVMQIPADQVDGIVAAEDAISTISGTVTWSGATLNFRPTKPLTPGAAYQVVLQPGATSDSGRKVIAAYRYSFTVRAPRVAFLAPADRSPMNIWMADPTVPDSAQQVTSSTVGIYDFGVSPDGSKIAFSEKNPAAGTMDINVLDMNTGEIEQVTNCADAVCRTPVWRPDGQVIAYERIDLKAAVAAPVGASPARIWLIGLTSQPATTRPLFDDSQIVGYGVRWSGDGNLISMFDYGSQGILVHDFLNDSTEMFPNKYGRPGELSPDGTKIIFPEVTLVTDQATGYLQIVDRVSKTIERMTDPNEPVDDDSAIWTADNQTLIVRRRYTDNRYTRGSQIYLINPTNDRVEPLIVDPNYQNGLFLLDPTGTRLVVQRLPDAMALNDPNNPGLPEIWTLDMQTKTLVKVVDNAFFPRWVP